MAKLALKVASTSRLVRIFIQDSSQTDGRGLTGLVFGSPGLVAYYIKDGQSSATQITLITMTVGTWVSGGFKEVDATNLPGIYELGLPDAAISTGKNVLVMLKGGTNMVVVPLEIELEAVDNQDTVRYGLTALPNVAAGANGGLPTGNASGQVTVASFANNAITAAAIATDAITAAKIAADAIGASELAADAITEIQSGLATSSALATVQADTDDIQTRLPAALVGGRMDVSVGAMAAAVLTATAIAADAITAAKIAADAIGASELAADAVTEIQNGLALATALATAQTAITDIQSRIPATLVAGRIDSSVGAMATSVLTATAIAADAIGASEIASDAIAEIQSGLATSAALATVQADTDDIQSRLPAALVGGKIEASVGALGSGAITNTTFAAGAIDASAIATDAIGSDEVAASAVTKIQSGLATAAALAIVAGFIDTEIADIQARLPAALVGGRMDSSVGAMAANTLTASALASDAVDEILDETIGDGSMTLRQALRVLIAGMAGKLSGAATTTVTIRNLADSADVVVATVDADGNRSAVTVTP